MYGLRRHGGADLPLLAAACLTGQLRKLFSCEGGFSTEGVAKALLRWLMSLSVRSEPRIGFTECTAYFILCRAAEHFPANCLGHRRSRGTACVLKSWHGLRWKPLGEPRPPQMTLSGLKRPHWLSVVP